MRAAPVMGIALWLLLASAIPDADSAAVATKRDPTAAFACSFSKSACQWQASGLAGDIRWTQSSVSKTMFFQAQDNNEHVSGALRSPHLSGFSKGQDACFTFTYINDLQKAENTFKVEVMKDTETSVEEVSTLWSVNGYATEDHHETKEAKVTIKSEYLQDKYRIVFIATVEKNEGRSMVKIAKTAISEGTCITETSKDVAPKVDPTAAITCSFTDNSCKWDASESKDVQWTHSSETQSMQFQAVEGKVGVSGALRSPVLSGFIKNKDACFTFTYINDLQNPGNTLKVGMEDSKSTFTKFDSLWQTKGYATEDHRKTEVGKVTISMRYFTDYFHIVFIATVENNDGKAAVEIVSTAISEGACSVETKEVDTSAAIACAFSDDACQWTAGEAPFNGTISWAQSPSSGIMYVKAQESNYGYGENFIFGSLQSPPLSGFPENSDACFKFRYRIATYHPGSIFRVGVINNKDSSLETLWHLFGSFQKTTDKTFYDAVVPIPSKYVNDNFRIVFIATIGSSKNPSIVRIDDTAITTEGCTVKPSDAAKATEDCDFTDGLCNWQNIDAKYSWQRGQGTTQRTSDRKGEEEAFFLYSEGGSTSLLSRPIPKGLYCFQLFYFVDLETANSPFPQLDVNGVDYSLNEKPSSEMRIFTKNSNRLRAGWHQLTQTIDITKEVQILIYTSTYKMFLAIDDISIGAGKCEGIEITDANEYSCDFEDSGCNFKTSKFQKNKPGDQEDGSNPVPDHTKSSKTGSYMYATGKETAQLTSDQILSFSQWVTHGDGDKSLQQRHCLSFYYNMKDGGSNGVLNVYQVETTGSLNSDSVPIYNTSTANPTGWTEAVVSLPSWAVYTLVFESEGWESGEYLAIDDIRITQRECVNKYEKWESKYDARYLKTLDWDADQVEEQSTNKALYAYQREEHPNHSFITSVVIPPSIPAVDNCFTFKYQFSNTSAGGLRFMVNAGTSNGEKGTIVELWNLNSNEDENEGFTRSWFEGAFNIDKKWLGKPSQIIIDAYDIATTRPAFVFLDDIQLLGYTCPDGKPGPTEALRDNTCDDDKSICFKGYINSCTCRIPSDAQYDKTDDAKEGQE